MWELSVANQPDSDTLLAQFRRLMNELLGGEFRRNAFQPWEVQLLLDIEGCRLRESQRERVLKRYQKAMEARIRNSGAMPIKLSEFLKRRYRQARPPDSSAS
ncbi:MAG: hypothetical protein RMK57_08045 [Bryobacterales bacterium]|nr:hypothetical protein [Bryobacteraceae bacterium]MDW8354466.1 hypothetical protein [Bryobacterales bacterium]